MGKMLNSLPMQSRNKLTGEVKTVGFIKVRNKTVYEDLIGKLKRLYRF